MTKADRPEETVLLLSWHHHMLLHGIKATQLAVLLEARKIEEARPFRPVGTAAAVIRRLAALTSKGIADTLNEAAHAERARVREELAAATAI